MKFDEFINKIDEDDLNIITEEFYKRKNKIPTYQFSSITTKDLISLVDIKENIIDETRFNEWFEFEYSISASEEKSLKKLLDANYHLIPNYSEEDLKLNFIGPVISLVNFLMIPQEIRSYYEESLVYKTDKFIFSGTTDFLVSTGLNFSEKPYFFLQEFKKEEYFKYPKPQLLAELIAAVELNNYSEIKGAFVIGQMWTFVILEKLGDNKYQYFISESFNSRKIEELKVIYKNLKFIKDFILKEVEKDKENDKRAS